MAHTPWEWDDLLTGTSHHVPARAGERAPWPAWVPDAARSAWPFDPWQHQVDAAQAVHRGEHVLIATGTASGKSLGYAMPIAAALETDHTALYVSPTKALAADQLHAWQDWAIPGVRAATVDGDSSPDERAWARRHANLVLTNPDMLHFSLLPSHEKWSRFWRRLAVLVIDEAHTYKGVFGAHVGLIVQRTLRIAAHYGATPRLVLVSATVGDPQGFARQWVNAPVTVIDTDTSTQPERTVVLAVPKADENGEEPSAALVTAELLARAATEGSSTIAFVRSRRAAEYVAATALDFAPNQPIKAYRGGFLAEERRALEEELRTGATRAVAATNALELGIDLQGLDAVITSGWPGTRASIWQQFGRAGRAGSPAHAFFIARTDPLDRYVVDHPETLLDTPVETSVFTTHNPYVRAPHLLAAAQELPITADDQWFGDESLLEELAAEGLLRKRPTGYFWTARERAVERADLRGTGGPVVRLVEEETGRLLGTVDAAAAHRSVHDGAVYVHQGETYVVHEFALADDVAFLERREVDYTTFAQDVSDVRITEVLQEKTMGEITLGFGQVDVTAQTVSYQRRSLTGESLGYLPLDLPPRTLSTHAMWWTLPSLWVTDTRTPGAVHAAEHAAIGMLPLFATCDRADIGGLSTSLHPDTGTSTVIIYDGVPGGAGFAQYGFDHPVPWLRATRERIAECRCVNGCPSCVQSPKCGNGNEPLDKSAALDVLDVVLAALTAD